MQVLTAQYPTMYTRKFRLTFADFQPNATRRSDVLLFTLPKANQIVSVAMKSEIAFKGGGVTSNIAYIFQGNNLPAVPSITGAFAGYRTFNAPSDKNGTIVFANQILSNSAPTNNENWCNFSAPTDIYCSLLVDTTHTVNNLTAGSLLVLVTSLRVS